MTVTRYKRQQAPGDAIREAVLGIARYTPKRASEAPKAEKAAAASEAPSAADRAARGVKELKEHFGEVLEKEPVDRAPMSISSETLARAKRKRRNGRTTQEEGPFHVPTMFKPYSPPPGVLPQGAKPDMAMDGGLQAWADDTFSNSWNSANPFGAAFAEGIGFLGYAYLSELTQRPEYRRISERIATEMTRKWIRFTVAGEANPDSEDDEADDADELGEDKAPDAPLEDEEEAEENEDRDNADSSGIQGDPSEEEDEGPTPEELAQRKRNEKLQKKIIEIEADMKRLDVRGKFRKIAEHGGWFGRAHLYVDIKGASDDDEELKTDIGNGSDKVSQEKFEKGSLENLLVREAIWCYPVQYNSNQPLKEDWYTPTMWFVLGKQVHYSRLLTFIPREVPDILKPAYAFGGLSMSQMAKPYVDNWLRTRQAVTALIESFSVSGVYTNAQSLLQGGGEEVLDRIDMFNINRTNSGCFVLDKETEEFFNVSTPLGSLDHLQAQSQEQMSSVSGIPLIVLLGITPTGLNASSEGELRVFYDLIHAEQENQFRDKLKRVIDFIQLNLFGEVDDAISFEFEPLWSLDEKGEAEVKKIRADTHAIYIDSGVVSPEEVRKIEIADDDSPYNGLDPDDTPEPPAQEGIFPVKGGGKGGGGGESDSSMGAADAGVIEIADDVFALDIAYDEKDFDESKHKRDQDGQFATTSAGGAEKSEAEAITGEKPIFKNKKEQIGHMLLKGTTPKEVMQTMGWPSVSMNQQAKALGMKLEKKDGKYFGTKMTPEELAAVKQADAEAKKGKETDAQAQQILKNVGLESQVGKAPPAANPEMSEAAEQAYSVFLGEIKDLAAKADKHAIAKLVNDNPKQWSEFKKHADPWVASKVEAAIAKKDEPKKPMIPPATGEEMKKAKKSTTLSLHLIPGEKPEVAGSPQMEMAQANLKAFNEKYAGKENLTAEQLSEKVHHFKQLQKSINAGGKEEASKKAEIQAEANKKAIEAAKKAAVEAEKKQAAEKAKLKEQHKEVREQLGIKESAEIEAFDSFIEHFGGADKAIKQFKSWQATAQKEAKDHPGKGYEKLSGFEMGCIKAYTCPKSGWINDSIINDSQTPAQYMFEKVLNSALDKLPKVKAGTVLKRGLTMDSTTLAKMQPGKIWTHRNFASSNHEGWDGNVKLHITSSGKGAAFVGDISSHEHENESLFKSNLRLMIDKVEDKGGVKHVHCREM